MTGFADALASLLPRCLDSIVYLGATAADVYPLMALHPGSLVVAQGDADEVSLLRSMASVDARLLVHDVVLAVTTGPADWHRYNLPRLTGLIEHSELSRLYPRLQTLSSTRVEAFGVEGWLATLCASAHSARSRALVIDLPCMEGRLLSALSDSTLQGFSFVVVQCGPGSGAGVSDLEARLAEAGFVPQSVLASGELLWPVLAWKLGVDAVLAGKLRSRISELEQQCSDLSSSLTSSRLEAHELGGRLLEATDRGRTLELQVDNLSRQLADTRAALAAAEDKLVAEKAAMQAQAEEAAIASAQHGAALESKIAELDRQCSSLSSSLTSSRLKADALGSRLLETQQDLLEEKDRGRVLDVQVDDLARRLSETSDALVVADEKLLAERQSRELEALDAARRIEALGEEVTSIRTERDSLADQVSDLRVELEEAFASAQQREALEARCRELLTEQGSIRQQLHDERAAAAIALAEVKALRSTIASSEITTKALREELVVVAAGVRVERDELFARCAELSAELEAARQAEQSRAADAKAHGDERDALAHQVTEQRAELQSLGQVLASLRQEADELRERLEVVVRESGDLRSRLEAEGARASATEQRLGAELADARQATGLALKLQSLREADLADLQQRYARAMTQQQSQHELLKKLGHRLTVALHYFEQLVVEERITSAQIRDTSDQRNGL